MIAKVDSGIWFNEILRRCQATAAKGTQLCIIGGLRYMAEAAAVHEAGGIVIRVERPDIAEADASDPTERERGRIPADAVILNNGTLHDLEALAERLYADLRKRELKVEYCAI